MLIAEEIIKNVFPYLQFKEDGYHQNPQPIKLEYMEDGNKKFKDLTIPIHNDAFEKYMRQILTNKTLKDSISSVKLDEKNILENDYFDIINNLTEIKENYAKNLRQNKDLLDDIFSNHLLNEQGQGKSALSLVKDSNYNIPVNDINLFFAMEDSPRQKYDKIFKREPLENNFTIDYFLNEKQDKKNKKIKKEEKERIELEDYQEKFKQAKLESIEMSFSNSFIKPKKQIEVKKINLKNDSNIAKNKEKNEIYSEFVSNVVGTTDKTSPSKTFIPQDMGLTTKSAIEIVQKISQDLQINSKKRLRKKYITDDFKMKPQFNSKLRIILFYFEDILTKVKNYGTYL